MACSVVIVEDETLVADTLELMLNLAGHTVRGRAKSGAGALLLADAHRPDIVLMDVGIAGSHDGIEIAAKIYDTLRCGIVFVTARTDPKTRALIKAAIPSAEVTGKPPLWPEIDSAFSRVSQCAEGAEEPPVP